MPGTFKIKDALSNLGVMAPFGVNSDGVHAFECLRLLTGTVNLEDKITGKVLKLRRCFLTEQLRRLKANSLKEVIDVAFDSSVSTSDMEEYLKLTKRMNYGFWENLKGELSLALAAEYKSNYTEAFLHIYRLLEMSAVALPLFYATAEYDYRRALSFLKELPSNPRDGDLAILKKFSETLSREGGYSRHKIEIYYSKGSISWDDRYSDQIQTCVIDAEKLKSSVDVAAAKIDVPFQEFPSFVVSFRNRLFHNTLSVQNFDLDALGGANATCEPIVRPALNWFTLSLCVILKQSVARYS